GGRRGRRRRPPPPRAPSPPRRRRRCRPPPPQPTPLCRRPAPSHLSRLLPGRTIAPPGRHRGQSPRSSGAVQKHWHRPPAERLRRLAPRRTVSKLLRFARNDALSHRHCEERSDEAISHPAGRHLWRRQRKRQIIAKFINLWYMVPISNDNRPREVQPG